LPLSHRKPGAHYTPGYLGLQLLKPVLSSCIPWSVTRHTAILNE
jgi:hypothetical protein